MEMQVTPRMITPRPVDRSSSKSGSNKVGDECAGSSVFSVCLEERHLSLTRLPNQLPEPIRHIDVIANIGYGAYAQVLEIRDRDRKRYALKVVEKEPLEVRGMLPQLEKELGVLCCVRHPRLLCALELFEDESHTYVKLELCPGGSVQQAVQHFPGTIVPEALAAIWLRDATEAVAYLHTLGLVHRDVKLENLLLDSARTRARLCDFGWCTFEVEQASGLCGTPQLCSPEAHAGEAHSNKLDAWALGACLVQLLQGAPLSGPEDARLSESGGHSQAAYDLADGLLKRNPDDRISATEALHRPLLKTAEAQIFELDKLAKPVSPSIQLCNLAHLLDLKSGVLDVARNIAQHLGQKTSDLQEGALASSLGAASPRRLPSQPVHPVPSGARAGQSTMRRLSAPPAYQPAAGQEINPLAAAIHCSASGISRGSSLQSLRKIHGGKAEYANGSPPNGCMISARGSHPLPTMGEDCAAEGKQQTDPWVAAAVASAAQQQAKRALQTPLGMMRPCPATSSRSPLSLPRTARGAGRVDHSPRTSIAALASARESAVSSPTRDCISPSARAPRRSSPPAGAGRSPLVLSRSAASLEDRPPLAFAAAIDGLRPAGRLTPAGSVELPIPGSLEGVGKLCEVATSAMRGGVLGIGARQHSVPALVQRSKSCAPRHFMVSEEAQLLTPRPAAQMPTYSNRNLSVTDLHTPRMDHAKRDARSPMHSQLAARSPSPPPAGMAASRAMSVGRLYRPDASPQQMPAPLGPAKSASVALMLPNTRPIDSVQLATPRLAERGDPSRSLPALQWTLLEDFKQEASVHNYYSGYVKQDSPVQNYYSGDGWQSGLTRMRSTFDPAGQYTSRVRQPAESHRVVTPLRTSGTTPRMHYASQPMTASMPVASAPASQPPGNGGFTAAQPLMPGLAMHRPYFEGPSGMTPSAPLQSHQYGAYQPAPAVGRPPPGWANAPRGPERNYPMAPRPAATSHATPGMGTRPLMAWATVA
eukprot:TRINITY_DN17001_c0_g1_i1.p1 TRINITY_DN17001_c0_g1~~TRINITY_DN17001_c0_g1_i1.p1  ORF type:complete len:988 (+),score=156.60 TRINITY_DN17001_c0_g1_i1:87-3050(+)